MGNLYSSCNDYVNNYLNYATYNLCQEKPTLYMVTKHLNFPGTEKNIIEELLINIYKVFSSVLIPVKIINDIKFCVHTHQSNFTFVSNGQENKRSCMPFYEKVLISLFPKFLQFFFRR